MVLVHIAGGHNHIALAVCGQGVDQALAGLRVTTPRIAIERPGAAVVRVLERHQHHLLGQQVPARRMAQALAQPVLLGLAQHLLRAVALRRPAGAAALQQARVAGLAAAVLAGIEHMHAQQVAKIHPAVHLQAIGARELGPAYRHVFIPGLHCGLAAQQEHLAGHAVLVHRGHPVVVHLVVVPAGQEGGSGMRGLQVRIGLVLCVAATVIIQ